MFAEQGNLDDMQLARDRLGVKPLYWALLDDGMLLFGSELKSLMAYEVGGSCLRRDIDPLAMEGYFALGYVPEPRTIFRQAHKLPPGHVLTVRRGAPLPAPREYWDVNFTLGNPSSLADAAEELRHRLLESVRLFGPDDVAGFPDKVAQSVYPNPYCAASPELREGNAFRGTLTCPVDPKLATGKTTIDYEGVVFADRVVATRRMKIDSRPVPGTLSPEEQRQLAVGTALMNSFGNQITAVRTGDCG
jgi:hypothetical protein